jgi:hypothetical protein
MVFMEADAVKRVSFSLGMYGNALKFLFDGESSVAMEAS